MREEERRLTLEEAIRSRRSVRIYNETPVERDAVFKMIEAGMWAPTACNRQNYRFIYFDAPERLRQIAALGAAHFIDKTRQAILVLYDNMIDNTEYQDHIQSAAAVIENMLLTACDLGVSACWVCNLPAKAKLRRLLGIPRHYDPVALVTIGYSDRKAASMPRKLSVADVVHCNRFEPEKDEKVAKNNKNRIYIYIYIYGDCYGKFICFSPKQSW